MAHNGIVTRQRVSDLVALIKAHCELKGFYKRALAEYPPLPRTFDDEDEKVRAILAVRKPFALPYMAYAGDTPTAGQKQGGEFRMKLSTLMDKIRAHYELYGESDRSRAFPLASWSLGRDPRMSDAEILQALDRHLELLKHDLAILSPEALVTVRIETELPSVLREARRLKHQSQQKAADELGVSRDSYAGWEAGRHRPDGDNRSKVEHYIRSAFLGTDTFMPTFS